MMEVQRSRYIRDSLRPPPRLFLSHCESIGVSMRAVRFLTCSTAFRDWFLRDFLAPAIAQARHNAVMPVRFTKLE
jgi:hypothetical protein